MTPPLRPGPGARIGVISDTHGLLRPEALEALHGVDRILHAGDIGDPDHLNVLARIAPVTAIRGNIDRCLGRGPARNGQPDHRRPAHPYDP